MTTQPNIAERVSRLEGAYKHLATGADIAGLKVDVVELKADLKSDITGLVRWLVPTVLAGMAAAAGIAAAIGTLIR